MRSDLGGSDIVRGGDLLDRAEIGRYALERHEVIADGLKKAPSSRLITTTHAPSPRAWAETSASRRSKQVRSSRSSHRASAF
ncbi:hypothetical protein [Lysobacter enzymogenes]|uniref:hypothetical protein n=1 Tax=Lysobacter enzymogenes TaxID=69 RepID=UPI001116A7E0|nr:hypothetical protein [Lysobacter enzymogenes]UZW62176.1 hypothetical protein BV903_007775 [Lysobacter enzymogenes]